MIKYLLLLLILLQFGCKKEDTDAVDALTGTYVGTVLHVTERFYFDGAPHYQYDTIDYGPNIVVITKASSDSFAITGTSHIHTYYSVWGYNSSGKYARGEGQSGSSALDQITFTAATDSLYIISTFNSYDKGGSHSSSKTITYFSGKKQ